jgi:RNA recognition motif-containing protein
LLKQEQNSLITLSIRGLARSTTEKNLSELFAQHGKVHSVKLVKDLFSGDCRGFAEVKMEGHEARNAISALNFTEQDGSVIRVEVEKKTAKKHSRRR